MRGISKAFPGVQALDDVSFAVRAGEVHALLGENGAGKSTLMKILAGIYERDAGTFCVRGQAVGNLTPRRARELGIAIIHQELNMCQHLTVAENIFLGRESARFGVVAQRKMNEAAAQVLARLKLSIPPDTIVGRLPVSKQQMVEIAKALSTDCKVLIMDEPTSALTAREVEELNRIIRELTAAGCGVVYISHRLEELAAIADRVTILRDGKFVTSTSYKDTSVPEIISFMVGREIQEKFPTLPTERGRELLRVSHLSSAAVRDVSFSLYEGEILGFAGLMGAGRTELVRALFGADAIFSGTVELEGKPLHIHAPRDAIHNGLMCVPEDRKKEGVCVNLPVRDNIGLANLDWLTAALGVVRRQEEKRITLKAVDELKIKVTSIAQDAKNLSGGNQQKVVVAKWLARPAKVFLFDEPTRGIDVAAKVEIYHLMNRMKQQGFGVLFVSSEMPEVLGMADRILVMCEGRITGEMTRAQAQTPGAQEKIMAYATQFAAKGSVKELETDAG
jgi:ribose transport system ATP-binding protein